MGAGFQTARPVFVEDKMLKLPWQLMGDVIMRKDEVIDGFHEQASALNEQIKIKALAADKKQAAELARQYEDQVNTISDEIWKDPLNFQNHVGKLRGMSRAMADDMEHGKWAALEDRYAGHTASVKAAQEALKKEGFSDEYIQKKLSKELADAGELEYDAQTGNYNKYSALDLTAMPNTNDWIEKRLTDAAPEGSDITYDELKGGWIVTTGTKTEMLSEAQLAQIVNTSLKGDPELMAAIKQRSELGVSSFENVLDENGEILDPSYIADYEMEDGSIQKGLAFQDNFLGKAAEAGVKKFGFTKTTTKHSMKANPFAVMNAKAQIDRAAKIEEEQRNRDQTVLTFTENVQSVAGPDYDTFAERTKETVKTVAANKQAALDNYAKFMKAKGAEFNPADKEHPAYKAIMEDGDFSVLAEAGVSAYEINKLQTAHDRNLMQKYTLDGFRETYMNNVEAQYQKAVANGETADMNTWGVTNGYLRQEKDGVKVDKTQFSNFLAASHNNPVTREASWNWTGMTQKAIDRTKKEFESSYEMVPINVPGHGVTTINKLVQSGVAQLKQEKVPYTKQMTDAEIANVDRYNELLSKPTLEFDPKTGVDEEEELERLGKLSYIKKPDAVSYQIKTGTGYVNLEVDPKSLIPVAGLNTNGGVDMKFKMHIDGQPVTGTVPTENFSTESINAIKTANGAEMKVKLWLEKNAHANNIQTPAGFTVDVKDGFLRSGTGQKMEIFDQYGNIRNEARPLLLSLAPNL